MPQSQVEIRETVLAECEYLCGLELNIRHPKERPTRDELRSFIKHVHKVLQPLFETRWALKPSIPAVDKSWRERAVARLAQADITMFGIESRSADQPRDDHGRFSNSGGPAEKGVEKGETAKSRDEHKQAAKAHKEMAQHHEDAANKADAKADKEGVKSHLAAAYAHEAAAKAHSEAAGSAVHMSVPHDKARSLSISANNATAKAYKRH